MTDAPIADTDPLIEAARRRLIARNGELTADELRALSALPSERTDELMQLAHEVRAARCGCSVRSMSAALDRLMSHAGGVVGLGIAANGELVEARTVDQLLSACESLAGATPCPVSLSVLTEADAVAETDATDETTLDRLSDTRLHRWVAVTSLALPASELRLA